MQDTGGCPRRPAARGRRGRRRAADAPHDGRPGALADPGRAASIHRDTPVQQAALALLRQRAEALPVIGDDGRVAGVVTAVDLLRAPVALGPAEPDRRVPRARTTVGR